MSGTWLDGWFLPEWIAEAKTNQADLCRATRISPPTMTDLCGGAQKYHQGHVQKIAKALGIEPHELLLPPARAKRIRRFEADLEEMADDVNKGRKARSEIPKKT